MAEITLSLEAQNTLFMDVCQRHSIEACGILLGNVDEQGNWSIRQAQPLRNMCDSPTYFEFVPEDLLMAELAHPGQIVGVYHSHPKGSATASSIDCKNMERVNRDQHIPWVWLILRGPFNETFIQTHQGCVPIASMIAYHHYAQEGLRQISIHVEERTETVPQERQN